VDDQLFVTPGLGDNSYLLVSGNEAALIDPQRDAWRFLSVAGSRQFAVRYVLETHVHNDYVTGALEVRAATGAEVAAPARGKYEFPHRRPRETSYAWARSGWWRSRRRGTRSSTSRGSCTTTGRATRWRCSQGAA